jgi:alkylation response protein AidB-like acyl-CoA dehydrogenase
LKKQRFFLKTQSCDAIKQQKMQRLSRQVQIFQKISLSTCRTLQKSFVSSATTPTIAPSAVGTEIIDPTIGLSEDQIEIYRLARSFADKELRPYANEWDEKEYFPLETYKKLGDLGFSGISIKEDVGGSGLSRLDNTLIMEALATGDISTAGFISIHNMCAGMIDRFGNEEQRHHWIPQMMNLGIMASYCLTEPGRSYVTRLLIFIS